MNIGQGKAQKMKLSPKLSEHRTRQYQKDKVVFEVG
ncbi:hypothetical protein JOC76_001941 [Neobacillus cucumis]|nr:hypothetical protein [Neobacillus cucumis]